MPVEKRDCLSPEGSGGRRMASSPRLRGNASAPSPCPASSVTTATSPGCPPTRSHTRGRWRTRCLVRTRSSPTWTCSPGRNQTQVRTSTTAADLFGTAPPQSDTCFRSQLWSHTQSSIWVLAAVRLGGSVSVSDGLQTLGTFVDPL